jgi:putative ATPase
MPLAEALHTRSTGAVVSRQHLPGPGKPLNAVARSGRAHLMMLWGLLGVGKTTLSPLIGEGVDSEFVALSAVMAGRAELRAALDQPVQQGARGRRMALFVDEIHRLSNPQQELLPSVTPTSSS